MSAAVADAAHPIQTERLLAVVDLVDSIASQAGDPEGLRRELLTLHAAAHRILNGALFTAGPAAPHETADMAMSLADQLGGWIDRLIEACDLLTSLSYALEPPTSGPPVSARQSGIFGWKDHPFIDRMNAYRDTPPLGKSVATLDYLAWGKSHNLLCYFTDDAAGARFRLSVFFHTRERGESWTPYQGGLAFNDNALIGRRFEITTSASRNGMAKFDAARLLD